jgi:hypothetical protein
VAINAGLGAVATSMSSGAAAVNMPPCELIAIVLVPVRKAYHLMTVVLHCLFC